MRMAQPASFHRTTVKSFWWCGSEEIFFPPLRTVEDDPGARQCVIVRLANTAAVSVVALDPSTLFPVFLPALVFQETKQVVLLF